MHRLFLGAAIASAATSAFAADAPIVLDQELAQPHISGYGELYLGGLYFSVPGDHETGTGAGGAVRVNFPIDARWNIQTDARPTDFTSTAANGQYVLVYKRKK